MGKPLSLDLRSRLVAAVSWGMSRRGAAERFGVSAASAVRWLAAVNTTGSVEAKPQGGDTRSHRIEAFSAVILAAVEGQKDISLVELAELLRTEHGASFAASTVWRCLDRHGMTFKKNSARSRAGATRRRRPATGIAYSDDPARVFQLSSAHRSNLMPPTVPI
jgi:transposase